MAPSAKGRDFDRANFTVSDLASPPVAPLEALARSQACHIVRQRTICPRFAILDGNVQFVPSTAHLPPAVCKPAEPLRRLPPTNWGHKPTFPPVSRGESGPVFTSVYEIIRQIVRMMLGNGRIPTSAKRSRDRMPLDMGYLIPSASSPEALWRKGWRAKLLIISTIVAAPVQQSGCERPDSRGPKVLGSGNAGGPTHKSVCGQLPKGLLLWKNTHSQPRQVGCKVSHASCCWPSSEAGNPCR